MLLLTMNKWLGPGRQMTREQRRSTVASERQMAFATRLTLQEAITKIVKYKIAYNKHYLLALEFSLLQVSKIDDLPNKQLDLIRVDLVENLTEDFE